MLESILSALCKISTFFKLSYNKSTSPSTKATVMSKTGPTAASSGANSPIHIGDNIYKNSSNSVIDPESRFKNHLVAVANELPYNFCHRGNAKNPFLTQALENLVYNEPMIHRHPELLQKASVCLNTAKTLSTASPNHPKLKPGNGQNLMKDLAKYISNKYKIQESKQE